MNCPQIQESKCVFSILKKEKEGRKGKEEEIIIGLIRWHRIKVLATKPNNDHSSISGSMWYKEELPWAVF